jgi:hypothetical protein
MTEKEIREIYDRLLALTKSRAIQWKKTGDSEYSVSFSRSSVTIEQDHDHEFDPIILEIFNEEGILVAYAALEELYEAEGVKKFVFDPSELFYLVEEGIYKYSQTSENILNELRKLELQKGG